MAQLFRIHPTHPQLRLLTRVARRLPEDGLLVYPTDTTYALGCRVGQRAPLDRIRALRGLGKQHLFTLCCRDLSELAQFARVDNQNYRILKRLTPGAFTFLLPAAREAPRRLVHPKRRTIGLRAPANAIARGLMQALGEPMMTSTLRLPEHPQPLTEIEDIRECLHNRVDLIIDGGPSGIEPTTVVDLTSHPASIVRQGVGQIDIGPGARQTL